MDYSKKARKLKVLYGNGSSRLMWTEYCETALKEIKETLTCSGIFRYRKRIYIGSDWCSIASKGR